MTHEERMELARRLCDLILQRYGDKVLAVFVTSSTARELDLEFSDLELTAVHRDGTAPESRSYNHGGILVEVEHIEESRILDQRMRRTWPISAGEYRGRIVLHEKNGGPSGWMWSSMHATRPRAGGSLRNRTSSWCSVDACRKPIGAPSNPARGRPGPASPRCAHRRGWPVRR